MLSIITPLFCDPTKPFIFERAKHFIENAYTSAEVERIIVDFGSPEYLLEEVGLLCRSKNIVFLPLRNVGQGFSAGVCRNHGAQIAKGQYVTFQDIDLYGPPVVYDKILNRIEKYRFFNELEIIPCVYLTKNGTERYLELPPDERRQYIFDLYLEGDKETIHSYAPCTSSVLLKKDFFLMSGGNRPDFFGHGYEDFDSLNRLANLSQKFVRPRNYYAYEFTYDSPEYQGFRPFFALFGRQMMAEGIYFVHLWHPTGDNRKYESRNRINRDKFVHYLKEFDQTRSLPPVLHCEARDNEPVTLVLGFREGKTVGSIRQVIPFLGPVVFMKENDFADVEEFAAYLRSNKVSRVFFFNPYGNDKRLSLYEFCRSGGINYIVFDRGALPDSWFFDVNGFNAASSSYAPANWNKPLSSKELIETENYIFKVLNEEETLERNGARVGTHEIRKQYGLKGKKVIFVPFQRPNDSVIRHFSGETGSIEKFAHDLDKLAADLGSGWAIVAKLHPLETKPVETQNIVWVDPGTHFYDLIAFADAVLLINSGVGLFSLMFGKPTYCVGKSFYSHPGLAIQLANVAEFEQHKTRLAPPDIASVKQFIHYLISKFYSFGKTNYIEVTDGDSKRTVATNTDFTVIRIGAEVYETPIRDRAYGRNSPLLSQYRVIGGTAAGDSKHSANVFSKEQKVLASKNTEILDALAVRYISNRKLRKLVRTPVLFFKDSYKNLFFKDSYRNRILP